MRELIKKRIDCLSQDCYQTMEMIQKTFPKFEGSLARMSLIHQDINAAKREYELELKEQDGKS
jgi:hypothetical protein